MRSRSTTRFGALVGLALGAAIFVGACAPEVPPPASTTSTSTTSTTTTSTTTTSTIPGNQAPVAVASTSTPAPGYFGLPTTLSSAGSTDADGTIVSYHWDFGGQTSTGFVSNSASPVTAYRQPGPYTATLTVTDDDGATGTATVVVAAPAPAGDVVLSQNPVVIPANPGDVRARVWWNNQDPNTLMFISVCRKSKSDPTFNVALDCAMLSEENPFGTPSGSGSSEVTIFRGPDPAEEPWGLFAAADTAPPGIQKVTTGYVRVTNNQLQNNDEAKEIAFTISGS